LKAKLVLKNIGNGKLEYLNTSKNEPYIKIIDVKPGKYFVFGIQFNENPIREIKYNNNSFDIFKVRKGTALFIGEFVIAPGDFLEITDPEGKVVNINYFGRYHILKEHHFSLMMELKRNFLCDQVQLENFYH
jgi:hypothetical protein